MRSVFKRWFLCKIWLYFFTKAHARLTDYEFPTSRHRLRGYSHLFRGVIYNDRLHCSRVYVLQKQFQSLKRQITYQMMERRTVYKAGFLDLNSVTTP